MTLRSLKRTVTTVPAAASVPADLSGDARALFALLLSLSRRRQAALRKREVD